MEQLTYEEIRDYLVSVPKFTGKHTMEDTRAFFEYLGRPCAKANIIHVAGTNGKGSVCAYLRGILMRLGSRTAAFVSPHLVSVRERFLFDGQMVSKESFCKAFEDVADALFAYEREREGVRRTAEGVLRTDADTQPRTLENLRRQKFHPSYFEFLFFMFLMMPQTGEAQYLILETGLGGRLDATNVMPDKAACIITRIGIDHTEYLGDTKEKIALEKAGIMRKGTLAVYLDQEKSVSDVIEGHALQIGALARSVGSRDFKITEITDKSIAFSYQSVYDNAIGLSVSSPAPYQAENVSLAVRCLELLDVLHAQDVEKLREAVAGVRWEARMDQIAPGVYLDGAHNEDGMRAFLDTVRAISPKAHRNVLLLAIVNDKRYGDMAKMIALSGLFEKIYVTKTGGGRQLEARVLADTIKKYGLRRLAVYDRPDQAFESCMKEKTEDQRVFIAGSLYLAGQIKSFLGRNSDD